MAISPNHLSHPQYRPDIDGLRAIAVLSVVAFHAFPEWVKGGFTGVDIFFVISGFLISSIIFDNLDKDTFSFREFYARRVKRIFPALIIVMFSCYAFGWFALLGEEYKQLGEHIAGGAGFVSNILLWTEVGYFDNAAETKPLIHLWSLGVEEQFYIVFPLFLWLAWKKNFNLITLVFLSALVSFVLNIKGVRGDAVATFYLPQTRFWELLCGSLLAWITLYKNYFFNSITKKLDQWLIAAVYRKPPDVAPLLSETDGRVSKNLLSLFGLTLLTLGFWKINKDFGFPGRWAVIPVLGAVLIIAAGKKSWVNHYFLSNKVIVWFGLISYPLYLWHWPVLSFTRIIESKIPDQKVKIAAVLISIILAWITYRVIEKPIRFSGNNTQKTFWLVITMTALGLTGLLTNYQDGFAGRAAIKGFVDNVSELKRTSSTDTDCFSYLEKEKPLVQYCKYTNSGGSETFAVVGDSHAHVSYPGIADKVKNEGINTVLLANGACPPLIQVPFGTTESAKELCSQRIDEIVSVLTRHKDVTRVFLFSRGAYYITGTEPSSGGVDVLNGQKIGVEDYRRGLQKTIDELVAAGKEVFYVTENPELAVNPEACLTRPFRKAPMRCDVSEKEVLIRQAEYRSLLSRLQNVQVLDSLNAFCPKGLCSAFDEHGSLLYADDDHLSVAGSRLQVAKLLSEYLIGGKGK